ncbi:MAG: protease complex subunit PrcB family protein [Chloroflexota bacterium]|nr:protease complex subunit PrcB family protein [Chloroflexota bacterium]
MLAACGSTAGSGGSVSPSPSTRSVAFTEVTATSQAGDDSGAMLIVGTTDASRAKITQSVPGATASSGRVLVAVFQGQQSTGGYSVHITAIERSGDELVVRATFGVPGPGAIVTQVLTSPAHVVSIAAADATGVREAVLLDQSGAEIARTTTT